MAEYSFDKPISTNYHFNLTSKIRHRISTYTGAIARIVAGDTMVLRFDRELTSPELTILNSILAVPDDAYDPVIFATIDNHYIVRDIWDWRDQIETDCGFNVIITYRSSGSHGSKFDEIVIQPTNSTYDDFNQSAKKRS
jgi:hypothetical protein